MMTNGDEREVEHTLDDEEEPEDSEETSTEEAAAATVDAVSFAAATAAWALAMGTVARGEVCVRA